MPRTPNARAALVVREHVLLDGAKVHGVTYDGHLVWVARDGELVAFDPERAEVVRRHPLPGAGAGTAFDGKHLYQLAGREVLVVDRIDGAVLRRITVARGAEEMLSGMAWADGFLWIGQYRSGKIFKIDPATGAIVKTLTSDRFVTGVSCVEGALWHGAVASDQPCELRRLGPEGSVEEVLVVPVASVAGLERTPKGEFWCAGEGGTLRLVRAAEAGSAG